MRPERAHRLAAPAAALAVTLGLAACGGVVGAGNAGNVETAESGPVEGELVISNWPGYVDPGKNNSLAQFTDRTGVEIEYIEDINANTSFFGKIQPQLAQGESGERSIFVVTDWMAKQMYDLGYLKKLDHSDLPTVFENIRPGIRSSALDPDREFSIPWQSGMTGIWVDQSQAPDITSVNDLFDPKYRGRVTLLDEMRDTVPMIMKADGIDPENATTEDWMAAIDKIREGVESGQIRRVTGNDYTEDITSGNAVASIGWSGDGYLISNPDAEWVMPDEGCSLWTDNMVIPAGAPNEAAALEYMNYVYEPEVQAPITAYINYVTPVDGVKEIFEQEGDKALAKDPLIFPSDEFTKNCSAQVNPPVESTEEITRAFEDVISG
jgi:spermidine/putrescine transport system substrate-binding protein